MVMRSSDFKDIVAPLLNEFFNGVYDQRKDEWKPIFKVRTPKDRSYHEEGVNFGFGPAPEMPEGTPVTYNDAGELYLTRYLHRRYGLAFSLSKTLVEDSEHISLGSDMAQHLAASLIETKETLTANVLSRMNTSTYNGGDGVVLCSASHPIVGGTASNILATAANLSQTSVEQMAIQVRTGAVNNNGMPIKLEPKRIICHPNNMMQAEVILNSLLRSGGANNDLNPVKSLHLFSDGVQLVTRLTSSTMWFVQNDVKKGLTLFERIKLEKSMEGDFETDSMRYKAHERYSVGWTDWRDVWGTPGV